MYDEETDYQLKETMQKQDIKAQNNIRIMSTSQHGCRTKKAR